VALRLRFWGTRGSVPSPGAHTARYGGNTACVELRTSDGGLVVLDAGTGIRALGTALVRPGARLPVRADVFVTHLPWDHVQGFPFFEPLWADGNRFVVRGPHALGARVEESMRAQMAAPMFPVSFDAVLARVAFEPLPADGILDQPALSYHARAFPVQHPDGAVGYRIACAATGRSIAYVPDNEIALHPGDRSGRDRLLAHLRGTELLVHDAMYSSEEVEQRRGWGHSSHIEATDLALEAGVQTLALFHHNPDRTDAEIDAMVAECERHVAHRGGALRVLGAAEGLVLEV
jgi:phosphoribosyl 1,2-cyclic phosphodiesterase